MTVMIHENVHTLSGAISASGMQDLCPQGFWRLPDPVR